MIRHILFDLDDTLLDFRRAEKEALCKTLRRMGVEPTEQMLSRYSVLNLSQWKLLEQGRLTRAEVKVRRYQLLFEEFGLSCDPLETTRIYEQMLAIGHYYMDGAEELLQTLSKRYALYVVSNGTAKVQHSRMASAGIERFLKDTFISETIGFDKPSRAFFDACFAKIPDFSPKNALIVGDSLTSDIQGGKNAGIATAWFNPHRAENHGPVQPDYEIHTLPELYDVLEQFER